MTDIYAVNERIRELRDFLGLGRAEFAEKTGLEKRLIENIEHKRQKVYNWHTEKIGDAFPEYAYWLSNGKTIPEAGQISPEIEVTRRAQNGKG